MFSSLKSEPIGKLINRIPGLSPLIQSLLGLALKHHRNMFNAWLSLANKEAFKKPYLAFSIYERLGLKGY